MAFADTIRAIPYAARTPQSSGFLPPLVRGMNHIINLLTCLADDNVTVTEDEAVVELQAAREHWNARVTTEAVSTVSTERAVALGTALDEAIAEYGGWNADTRLGNLRDLTHRILQYCADLDRELIGIRTSDAGTTL